MNKNKPQQQKYKQAPTKDVQTPMFLERKTQPPVQPPKYNDNPHQNVRQKQVPQQRKQDLNQKLFNLPIDAKFKEVLGPDRDALQHFAKKQQKQQKAIEKLKELGKIQIIKPNKQKEKQTPIGLQLTEDGKLKDQSGKIISIQEQSMSLKINQNKQKEEKIKDINKISDTLKKAMNDKGRHFDKNIAITSSNSRRQKRKLLAFNFIEKGSLLHNADIRNQQEEGKKMEDFQALAGMTAFKRVSVKMKHYDPVPNIEWWDINLFPPNQANYIPSQNDSEHKQPATAHTEELILNNIAFLEQLKYNDTHLVLERLTKLIEHPKPFVISELIQNREKAALPSFLTKKERKKRLRKQRMDIQKDKQDKIRLGLIKASPPRVRLQNMMKILGAEALIDPSKAEQEVRKQIQARLDKHIIQNEQRKLTKEERGDKLKLKWRKDASSEIRIAVFRIEDLSDPQHKFKVNMNAQQVSLQGVCLYANPNSQEIQGNTIPSIVVVEGGPKGIKFYKKLLLNRIKWSPDVCKVGCKLVWEGTAKQRAFNKWRTIEIRSEAEGKRILAQKGVEQFWDLAMNFNAQQ